MTTSLITGANRGLGFETARQLQAAGHRVWIGARDRDRGEHAAEQLGARFVELDVTDDASVAEAAITVGSLNVLVNNAGIPGERASAGETTAQHMSRVFDTNVFGPVRVMHAFLPLLERSSAPVVVNVSSGLGSLARTAEPEGILSSWAALAPAYSSSKSALNMLTIKYAAAFPQMRINAVDPGYTATDLNEHRGEQTVEEGAIVIVRLALIGPEGPTAGFFDSNGSEAW